MNRMSPLNMMIPYHSADERNTSNMSPFSVMPTISAVVVGATRTLTPRLNTMTYSLADVTCALSDAVAANPINRILIRIFIFRSPKRHALTVAGGG